MTAAGASNLVSDVRFSLATRQNDVDVSLRTTESHVTNLRPHWINDSAYTQRLSFEMPFL